MSTQRMNLDIDRVAIGGVSLSTGAVQRLGSLVESELAAAFADGDWPSRSHRAASVTVIATAGMIQTERAMAESIVASVRQALGVTRSEGSHRE